MRNDALKIFSAAVRAVQPQFLLPRHMRWQNNQLQLGQQLFDQQHINKLFIIGAGKASAAMAQEAEIVLGSRIDAGVIVTKYEHAFKLKTIQCIEAGHPVPDGNHQAVEEHGRKRCGGCIDKRRGFCAADRLPARGIIARAANCIQQVTAKRRHH
jgi:glycerate-2-kinase